MASDTPPKNNRKADAPPAGKKKKSSPEWANGLREIYDSVLEEPLPDSFNELLSKLDDPS